MSSKARLVHPPGEPMRTLAVKPADKMEVEGIIKEDILEVAQAKLKAFVRRCARSVRGAGARWQRTL